MINDGYGAARLRERVLSAWRESPARFRADANVEDDLALVGYRDRVVVELAQNAADAATRAGVAGRLELELVDNRLTAGNTGAPLDAAGVESISVARASAKVDQAGTVGRFGVGFAAVLAVTDEPMIVSTDGAVRWSRSDALAMVADLPELAGELASRGDRVPVLRLPFAVAAPLPMDADTVVVLPLRDRAAVAAVRSQLEALEPTVLLALPALADIVLRVDGVERRLSTVSDDDVVVLHDGATSTRWRVAAASGRLDADLLADLPLEERSADTWRVTWALPVDDAGRLVALPAGVAPVVRAPTAVDDPLTTPAVLIASYPLDASRRRVTAGALADAVTGHAAATLADLLRDGPADPSFLRLVPTGFPDGPVDGGLHAALLDRLRQTPWLPVAGEPEIRQRPRDAVAVADELVDVLAGVVPSLLPAGWARPELSALEVTRPGLGAIVDVLGGLDQEPAWWHRLYAALEVAVPPGPERDALGALPVPLIDGSLVTGPRGVVLPAADLPGVDLAALGVRMVHPGAAHPLLRSFGAVDGTARGLLDQASVQAAVEASYDEDDPEPIATAVLSLVVAAGVASDELPWLADLALRDDDGDWRPAGELLLPGGRLAAVVEPDSGFGVVAADLLEEWGVEALTAAGVLDAPALLREPDSLGPTHDLDGEAQWWATLPPDATVDELVAVRDLEQVRPAALGELLDVLAVPPLRAAIVEPALVSPVGGGRLRLTPYTAWWLSSRPVLGGRSPRELRLPSAEPLLDGLYDVVASPLDEEFLRAIGVVGSLDGAAVDDVLDRLADPGRTVGRAQLRGLYAWLAGQQPTLPGRVRAVRAGEVVVVDAEAAVVVDAPDLLPLLGDRAVVPVSLAVATDLADRLDLALASELSDFAVTSRGTRSGEAVHHDGLRVADVDGVDRKVAWRWVDDELHVDSRQLAVGLGRGTAWRDGEWAQRHRRTEALNQPAAGIIAAAEDDLDDSEE